MSELRLGPADGFADGTATAVDAAPVDGADDGVTTERLAVVRFGDQLHAVSDRCSHADFSLSEGEVDAADCTIECWKHGALFSLTTGEPECLPATKPVPVYDVHVVDGVAFARPRS
ncbi:MAG: non-heme iron oxygenase ferredoxin subunit [Acidimicrobiales bacterium]